MKKILASFLALVLAFGAPSVHAGYAQLKPPPGWSQGMGAAVPGQAGVFNFGSAANGASFKGGTVVTNAALNVAGQLVTIPVSMRVAANAATVAAEWSFGNPYLFVAALAAPIAYNWYKSSGLEVKEGIWQKTSPNSCAVGPCYQYRFDNSSNGGADSGWLDSVAAAASSFASKSSAMPPTGVAPNQSKRTWTVTSAVNLVGNFQWTSCYLTYQGGACGSPIDVSMTASRQTVAPTPVTWVPVTKPQFHEIVDPLPLPVGVPQELPDVKWPLEVPVINPNPAIDPLPAPSPAAVPRPLWLPTGDPVKNPNPERNPDGSPKPLPDGSPNPNAKPDTWTQPGVRVNPSPTPDAPWRVDINPEPITKTDPSPTPRTDGAPDPGATPKPATDAITCGLPGTPPCKIDEEGTPKDKAETYTEPKTEIEKVQTDIKAEIDKSAALTAPSWTFSFQLPTGCAPYTTGIRGFVMNICQFQSTIHDLLSMVWAATTAFVIIGMVGRTIRES